MKKENEKIKRDNLRRNKNQKTKKQMNEVLKYIKQGKTRYQAAKSVGIPLSKITHWCNEGKQGIGSDNITFYNQINSIEEKYNAQYSIKTSSNHSKTEKNSFNKKSKRFKTNEECKERLTKERLARLEKEKQERKERLTKERLARLEKQTQKRLEKEKQELEKLSQKRLEKEKLKPSRITVDIVLKAFRQGKSKVQAANLASVDVDTINEWYSKGKSPTADENLKYFAHEIKKIDNENKYFAETNGSVLKTQNKDKIKNTSHPTGYVVNVILSSLKEGKSKINAAEDAGITVNLLNKWYYAGVKYRFHNLSEYSNEIYLANEMDKIEEASSNIIKYCHYCGNRLIDANLDSCPNCGTPIEGKIIDTSDLLTPNSFDWGGVILLILGIILIIIFALLMFSMDPIPWC